MITRVATFPLSDQMINGALRTEATMANLQIQEASGVQSEFLAGYGADTQQVINLQVSVTRAQSYIDAATSADGKIEAMYSNDDHDPQFACGICAASSAQPAPPAPRARHRPSAGTANARGHERAS